MTRNPKIFHITHVDNLSRIAEAGSLLSDRSVVEEAGIRRIGMSRIKRRRLEDLEVTPHPGTRVGDYVPFYFCPRSIMLFVIFRRNHPELAYRGGQTPILHLEADLRQAVEWAEQVRQTWAFTLGNAGARYAQFRSSLSQLDDLDWEAIDALDFKSPQVKEGKQAEFIVHGNLPFRLIQRIGVRSPRIRELVESILEAVEHRPEVQVLPEWYF